MRVHGFRTLSLALGALLALGAAGPPKEASPDPTLPKVVLKELVDDRYGGGKTESGLILALKIEGEKLEDYPAGRALVNDARDDTGRSLLPKEPANPRFGEMIFSPLRLDLVAPPRSARSVSVSGTVELFAPKKDPGAVVKVPKALLALDRPLVSPGLSAAKIEVTPLSKGRYVEELKKQNGEEALARFRQEMKARGKSDEQITTMLEMRAAVVKAFSADESRHAVILMARNEEMLKIQAVTLLGADGQEIRSGGSSGGSDGVTATRRYDLKEAPDPNLTLVFTLYTDKARVSVPFELKNVPLP